MVMPCANTIHSWILRLGHDQLHRPLPQGEDWAWFIDLTLTIGPRKVLAIVGCRISEIPFAGRSLAPTDLTLLHLAVLDKSNSETVLAELQLTQQRVGRPRVILSDGGTDLVKGVNAFRQQSRDSGSVAHVLDIAHVGANALKKRFTANPRWGEFLQKLTQTNQVIRQKEVAYLLSPRLRDKGRFMSVGVVLRFARRMLYALDHQLLTPAGVEAYGWLSEYRVDVEGWLFDQQLVQETIEEIRENGWHETTWRRLEKLWSKVPAKSPSCSLVASLREFMIEMSWQAKSDETLPGSTEVLESCFGHWKGLVEEGPSVGVSGLVLALGAMLKPNSPEEDTQAWDTTPLKRVWNWVGKHVGATVQKMRKAFNALTAPALTAPTQPPPALAAPT
jgi:hypothetical protein